MPKKRLFIWLTSFTCPSQKENIFTIPNALCVFRVAASPVLVYLVVTSSYSAALGLFLFAGFTDLVS